jgi:hypothetical protein
MTEYFAAINTFNEVVRTHVSQNGIGREGGIGIGENGANAYAVIRAASPQRRLLLPPWLL